MTDALWRFLEFRGFQNLQNLHPLVVHYPIAFLTTSLPVYLLAWFSRDKSLEVVGLWLLTLGTLGAGAAVYTGWSAGEGVMIAPSVREHILVYHKSLMLATSSLSVVLAAWALLARPMPRRGRWIFVIGLAVMVLVLAKGADYGGWMVFGYNAGGKLPQPIEFSN
jgi:uncharacterized membrane protein